MKFFFALLAVTCAVASAQFFSEGELDTHFSLFKTRYGRVYRSFEEEQLRKRIFASNLEFIHRHNQEFFAGRKTFSVAMNNFTDISNDEFVRRFNGLRNVQFKPQAPATHLDESVDALPATVDWTTHNPPIVTPIKNQEQCGSCWAFSTTGSVEGQHALKTGKLVSLSEQNLMDCSGPQGDMSCEGGLMDNAFKYIISNKGIDTEASYPYLAQDEPTCNYKVANRGATISSYKDVKSGSEAALQNAVATVGPISVAIDASNLSFQFYSSGVYNEPDCSSTVLDHGVLAVGYGTQSGTPYWKVKNSWGTDWGMSGYILMSRNKNNQCGIATASSYPVV